jgi:hypothetical protein
MHTARDAGGQSGRLAAGAWLPSLRWRRVFAGEASKAADVRRFLAALLPDCPARDDVISVTIELASNAIRHTASGRGGHFAVEVIHRGGAVRVAVRDGGAPSGPRVADDPLAESGRGLLMVRALSERHGVWGDERGRLVWADIPWPDLGARLPDPWHGVAGHEHDGLLSVPDVLSHANPPGTVSGVGPERGIA